MSQWIESKAFVKSVKSTISSWCSDLISSGILLTVGVHPSVDFPSPKPHVFSVIFLSPAELYLAVACYIL